MSFDGDPYRVLGLARGASLAEVKRAYRLLVKQYHPDSAGERALPRFLAIQAAYESLVHGRQAPPRRPARPTPPWEADPARARATRDAYRRRTAGQSGARGGRFDRDADRRTADGAAGESRGASGGDASGEHESAGGATSGGAGGATGGGAGGATSGRAGGASWTRTSPGTGSAGERSRRRPVRKATLGSTSYDDARPPFEATWEGGTWYGASSGTYWTINPKEYADPRKHGPEYLARARRARRAARAGEPTIGDGSPEGAGPVGSGVDSPPAGATAETSPGAASSGAAPARDSSAAGQAAAGAGLGPGGRVVLALVGWPPIGLAIVAALGELSGCGRFAATCGADMVGAFGAATWLVQIVVLGVLLVLPPLARVAAAGAIGLLAASIPVAILLSAIGGSRDPATASLLLVILLAIAWLAGAAIELAGGRATRFALGRRVG